MPNQYCPDYVRSTLIHAKRRAFERYSVRLTEFDIFKMSDLVLQGKAKFKKKFATRMAYKLNYMGKNFVIIFDTILMTIVTFLPRRALRDWQ